MGSWAANKGERLLLPRGAKDAGVVDDAVMPM